MKGPNPLTIEASLATGVCSIGLGPSDTLALALLDEAAFHLRDHAKHGQHDMPDFATRRDMGIEHGDAGTALLGFVHDIEHVSSIAPKPVEPKDNQLIAGPEELENGREFGPPIPACP